MKQFLILAAVALTALSACTKVEYGEIPDRKVTFAVGNYVATTKAAEDPVQLTETTTFSSKAWLHANGAAQGTDFLGTIANGFIETVTRLGSAGAYIWEPDLEYFWPKGTGSYINFVSWYGGPNSKTPVLSGTGALSETVMNWGTDGAPLTIVSNDNILFADEAWRYTDNASRFNAVSDVAMGVPTLFHHALAQVAFKVRLSTKTPSVKTIWDVTINSVSLTVGNNGYLQLVNEDIGNTDAATKAWKVGTTYSTGAAATSANVGWSRPSTGSTTETIVQTGGTGTQEFATPAFTSFQPGSTASPANPANSGDFVDLLPSRSVLPQDVQNGVVNFGMTFTISLYHDANHDGVKDDSDSNGEADPAFSTEVVTVPVQSLYTLVGNVIPQWKMNTKYVYNITIDPVGKKVTFDPAVAAWASNEAETEIYTAN